MIYVGYLLRMLVDKLATRAHDNAHREDYYLQQSALLKGVAIKINAECSDALIVRRDNISVKVDFGQSRGKIQSVVWHLVVPRPRLPMFDIIPNTKPKAQPSALPWLDAAFKVTTSDPATLTQLWSPLSCQRLVQLSHRARVTCDGEKLSIAISPANIYPVLLENGIELLFGLAKIDPYGTAGLRALGTYHEQDLPYVSLDTAVPTRIGFADRGGRLVTEAHIAAPVLPDAAAAQAKALGATTSAVSGGVALTWPEVVRDSGRLAEIARLLRSVATPSAGVFR